jgi:hypothetical protein
MMARPENNLPATPHDGARRCLLAIEMGKQSWVIAATARHSGLISVRLLLVARNDCPSSRRCAAISA